MEIVDINASDCSCYCDEHQVCAGINKVGTVFRLALVSVVIDEVEEPVIEAVEVNGGYCVGFGSWKKASHKSCCCLQWLLLHGDRSAV